MAALLLVVATIPGKAIAANEAQLHLDGIVLVKEKPLDGTRVIVIDRDGPSTIISKSKDVGHFTLPLALDRTYLLSFEHEGCVTKQLLFDTRVSEAFLADAPFSFPFQVTLEPTPADAPFAYAGPVGFVRFYDDIHDFGYDTDYRIKRDAALTARLEQVRQQQNITTAPGALKATSLPAPVADEDAPKGHFEELAPTLTEVPPLVHNTGENATATAAPPAPKSFGRPLSSLVTPGPAQRPAPANTAAIKAPSGPALEKPEGPVTAQVQLPVLDHRTRSEQLIVEPRRVTTVIRLTDNGHTTEYRRVAHQYGAVFFFRNGGSCSEQTFQEARVH